MSASTLEQCQNLVTKPIFDLRRQVKEKTHIDALRDVLDLAELESFAKQIDLQEERLAIEEALGKIQSNPASTVPTMAVTGNVKSGKSSIVQCITGCGEFAAVGVKATTSLPFLFEHRAKAEKPSLVNTAVFVGLKAIVERTLAFILAALKSDETTEEEHHALLVFSKSASTYLGVFGIKSDRLPTGIDEVESLVDLVRQKIPLSISPVEQGEAALELTRWGHAALRLCLMIQPSLSAEVCELLSKPPVVRCEFPILGDRDIEFRLFDLPGAAEVGGEAFEKVVQDFMSQESNCIILARPMVGDFVPKQGGHDARLWQRIQSANRPVFVALTMADAAEGEPGKYIDDQREMFKKEELLAHIPHEDIFCVSSTQCLTVQYFSKAALLLVANEAVAKKFSSNEALKAAGGKYITLTLSSSERKCDDKLLPFLDRIKQCETLWYKSGYGPFLRRCIQLSSNEAYGNCQLLMLAPLRESLTKALVKLHLLELGDSGTALLNDLDDRLAAIDQIKKSVEGVEADHDTNLSDEAGHVSGKVASWHRNMDGDYRKDGEGITWTTDFDDTLLNYLSGNIPDLLRIHKILSNDPKHRYQSLLAVANQAAAQEHSLLYPDLDKYLAEFRFEVKKTRDNSAGRTALKIISFGASNFQRYAVRLYKPDTQSSEILRAQYARAHASYRKQASIQLESMRSFTYTSMQGKVDEHMENFKVAKGELSQKLDLILNKLDHHHDHIRKLLGAVARDPAVSMARTLLGSLPDLADTFKKQCVALAQRGDEPNAPKCSVLCLPGGGVRGLITVRLLQALDEISQDHCGKPLRELTDHVLGTSTGCIVAWLFAVGMPLEDIADLYVDLSSSIFPPPAALDIPILGKIAGVLETVRQLFETKYSSDVLEREFIKVAGDKKLLDHQCEFVKPHLISFDVAAQQTHIFSSDGRERVVDVLLGCTAAPTYFPARSINGKFYVDGGIAENHPGLHCFDLAPNRKSLIVTVGNGAFHERPELHFDPWGGKLSWASKFPEFAINGQMNNIKHALDLFYGLNHRNLEVNLHQKIDLDDADGTADQMQTLAQDYITAHQNELKMVVMDLAALKGLPWQE